MRTKGCDQDLPVPAGWAPLSTAQSKQLQLHLVQDKIKPTVLCQTHRLNLTMPTPSLKATYPQPSLTPTLHLSAHLFAVRSPHSTAPSLHAQPALMHCSWGRFWGLRNAQASPGSGFVEDMVPAVQTRSISRNY